MDKKVYLESALYLQLKFDEFPFAARVERFCRQRWIRAVSKRGIFDGLSFCQKQRFHLEINYRLSIIFFIKAYFLSYVVTDSLFEFTKSNYVSVPESSIMQLLSKMTKCRQ
jgi:hypothetical protein